MKTLKEAVIIIGEGGAGIEIVKTLIDMKGDFNYAAVVASDSERGKIRSCEDKLKGIVELDIDGTGKKTKFGYKNARKKIDDIKKLLGSYPIIFHVCGYGGGTGTGTALAIAQAMPNRRHIFIGPMSTLDEGRQIVKNTLSNLKMMFPYGRFWPMDNRFNSESLNYNAINRKIAEEIGFVLSLPTIKSYIMRDMDTGNVLDLIFPEQYYRKGLFGVKRFKVKDLENNISFENLKDRDGSVSFKFDMAAYEKVGLIIKLSKHQEMNNTVESNITQLKSWLFSSVPGASIHESIYQSSCEESEIILLLSGPVFSGKFLKDYTDKYKEMEDQYSSNFAETELVFDVEIENDLNFNQQLDNIDKDLFAETTVNKESNDLFADENDSFLDLLGK